MLSFQNFIRLFLLSLGKRDGLYGLVMLIISLCQRFPWTYREREGDMVEKVKGAAYEDARARRSSKVAILVLALMQKL